MKRLALPFLFVVVFSVAYGAIIRSFPPPVSNGTDIHVRWYTDDESTVQAFYVLRRAGEVGDFVEIAEVAPKGNYSSYEYIDKSVFKTSADAYFYRIRVQTTPSTYSDTDALRVSHTSSTARRTWGSIKAMFR